MRCEKTSIRRLLGAVVCALPLLFAAACIDITPTATEEARGYLTEYNDAKATSDSEGTAGDVARAVSSAETALGGSTGDPEADAALAADEVYDDVQEAEKLAGEGRDAMYGGRDTEARDKIDAAIVARPDSWYYRTLRGSLALRLGEPDYAKRMLEDADEFGMANKATVRSYLSGSIDELRNVPRGKSRMCNIILYEQLASLYERRAGVGEFLVKPSEDLALAQKYRELAERERRK